MKKVSLAILVWTFSQISFADVICKVNPEWGIRFVSDGQPQFTKAYQFFTSGEPQVEVTIQQAYMSPANFMARVELNHKSLNIQANRSGQNGEYAVYSGILVEGKIPEVVKCSQR